MFYTQPRLVVHIDDGAIAAVSQVFHSLIPPNSLTLDLMSSWRSHWPAGHPKQELVGLGMNAVEMAENPDLDQYVVQDINRNPELPFDDDTFDAVVITVSVQYLTQPIETFRQVNRILSRAECLLLPSPTGCLPPRQYASGAIPPTAAIWTW